VTLNHFTYPKEIVIDDAGWSDLLLGVVIGALKPPDPRYMERRIPTSSFQPPNFNNKKYLDDAVKIAEEIIVDIWKIEASKWKKSMSRVSFKRRLKGAT
jgi:hypothetical protein